MYYSATGKATIIAITKHSTKSERDCNLPRSCNIFLRTNYISLVDTKLYKSPIVMNFLTIVKNVCILVLKQLLRVKG